MKIILSRHVASTSADEPVLDTATPDFAVDLEAIGFEACAKLGLNAHSVVTIVPNETALIVFDSDRNAPDRRKVKELRDALIGTLPTFVLLKDFEVDRSDYLGLGLGSIAYKFSVS